MTQHRVNEDYLHYRERNNRSNHLGFGFFGILLIFFTGLLLYLKLINFFWNGFGIIIVSILIIYIGFKEMFKSDKKLNRKHTDYFK